MTKQLHSFVVKANVGTPQALSSTDIPRINIIIVGHQKPKGVYLSQLMKKEFPHTICTSDIRREYLCTVPWLQLKEIQQKVIAAVLEFLQGNQTATAKIVGMNRRTLCNRIHRLK